MLLGPKMEDIQELYNEYAFLDEACLASEAESQSLHLYGNTKWYELARTFIGRTYENPCKWYFVVFSPLEKAYTKHPDWFNEKGLSKCRDLFKHPDVVILTKEILGCNKVHVNALVCCRTPPRLNNKNTYCNKYYAHVQRVSSLSDRVNVLDYICKERKQRSFVKFEDYIVWAKQSDSQSS